MKLHCILSIMRLSCCYCNKFAASYNINLFTERGAVNEVKRLKIMSNNRYFTLITIYDINYIINMMKIKRYIYRTVFFLALLAIESQFFHQQIGWGLVLFCWLIKFGSTCCNVEIKKTLLVPVNVLAITKPWFAIFCWR